jgi:hypothetical protein
VLPHKLLAHEHCWRISTGSCLTILLTPWSRSERLPPVNLPEELGEITMLQQYWGVDGRRQNFAELTSARFLWQRHTEMYSPI